MWHNPHPVCLARRRLQPPTLDKDARLSARAVTFTLNSFFLAFLSLAYGLPLRSLSLETGDQLHKREHSFAFHFLVTHASHALAFRLLVGTTWAVTG